MNEPNSADALFAENLEKFETVKEIPNDPNLEMQQIADISITNNINGKEI